VLENKSALVVEGDAHSLVAISNLLRDLGVRFKRNTTGANVLEQLRTMQPLPDFILLEIDLPHGDAFTIRDRIRHDSLLERIPIIAIGDESLSELLPQMQRSGFASFVPKPIPRKHFGDLLSRVLAGERVWEFAV
jgi:CheY-like chemotaxis protein